MGVRVMYKNVFFYKSLMFIHHGLFLANFSGKPQTNWIKPDAF